VKQKVIIGLLAPSLGVCMWWFLMLGDNPHTVGPFWNQDQCAEIQKWAKVNSHFTPISPCWSDQQIPPEKE